VNDGSSLVVVREVASRNGSVEERHSVVFGSRRVLRGKGREKVQRLQSLEIEIG